MKNTLTDWKGQPTGVIFGFLSALLTSQEHFDAPHVIFCWDRGTSKRAKILPSYKANRRRPVKGATPEQIAEMAEDYRQVRRQMRMLHTTILPDLGYHNIFGVVGFEADDLIAKVSQKLPLDFTDLYDDITIISADHDLLQCITPLVRMYSPATNKLWTVQEFKREYRIEVHQWPMVKQIAGCSSDNIQGIIGVGEKTAIKYIRGKLKRGKQYDRIKEESGQIALNAILTTLPFRGTPPQNISTELPDTKQWQDAMCKLDIPSLVKEGPYLGRRRAKKGKRKCRK